MKRQNSLCASMFVGVGGGFAALAALHANDAYAVPINYGSFTGTNVIYTNVSEEATTPPDTSPLFGPPTVTDDSIDFDPLGFAAASSNGGSDLTNGNLVFGITAKPGSVIEFITLSEIGDTTMAGNVAPGSMATATAVFCNGTLDIHEVDSAGIPNISVPFALTFTPSGGTYFLGTDGGGGPVFNTSWTGSVTLDVDAILAANGRSGHATRVSIDLDNTLSAVSQAGTSSVIGKTDFGLRVDIPEPLSAPLITLAALAASSRRVRRQVVR
jgi:hypothetical protein